MRPCSAVEPRLSEICSFSVRRGPSASTQFLSLERQRELAKAVIGQKGHVRSVTDGILEPPTPRDDGAIFADVAESHGVSFETVQTAYYKHTVPNSARGEGVAPAMPEWTIEELNPETLYPRPERQEEPAP
jgi:hypothetical protein